MSYEMPWLTLMISCMDIGDPNLYYGSKHHFMGVGIKNTGGSNHPAFEHYVTKRGSGRQWLFYKWLFYKLIC